MRAVLLGLRKELFKGGDCLLERSKGVRIACVEGRAERFVIARRTQAHQLATVPIAVAGEVAFLAAFGALADQ